MKFTGIGLLTILLFTGCMNRDSGRDNAARLNELRNVKGEPGVINDRPVIVELTRNRIAWVMEGIVEEPSSINYGGFYPHEGYAGSRSSIMNGLYLTLGYIYKDFPEYYARPEILQKIRMHLAFLKRRQREDGSISLGTKEVEGSNEVGFTLPGFVEVSRRLEKSDVPGKEEILDAYLTYIRKGAECIRNNFPFTSNHRWAAYSAPLAAANSLFPDEKNIEKINEYLSDGIDMDADGLYYEEMSPNYNDVANRGLVMIADYLGKYSLLRLVQRNLDYELVMQQPNGEAETLFSRRQDRGVAHKDWGNYYIYKRFAIDKRNGQYATMADRLLKEMWQNGKGRVETGFIPLLCFFDDPILTKDNIPREPLPNKYTVAFKEHPIWRFRNGNVAATIAADAGGHWFDLILGNWKGYTRSNAFMSYHSGNAIIDAMKIIWAGGVESFQPEKIEYLPDGKIRLFYQDPGWDHLAHFRPKEKWGPRHIPGHSNAEVLITPSDEGTMKIKMKLGGWDDIPFNVQFLLREEGSLELPGDSIIPLQKNGRTFTSKKGDARIVAPDGSSLILSGLPVSDHQNFLGDSRYIAGKAEGRCHRLVVGLFSPAEFTFTIKPGRME